MTKMRPEGRQGKPGRSTGPETPTTSERLVERTCAWCGEPVAYSGRGRPPRYCTAAHRRRGWELRTAQDRAERPVDDGGRNQAPVREVVQRTIVLQEAAQAPPAPRPAQRLSGQPYTLPEDAVEWVEALAALRRNVTHPQIYPFREQVARACERAALALRASAPEPTQPEPDGS
ncbi:hypothetical protein O1Q96_00865 (plasmid) [Streptomyces sp. Qhu-G9]|uniref:hypothetical protein n=1 Tax=Streptomyces sp. Qhu-G9 TaxID=3452799 RepID=UPI0022AC8729|nr:hypothetical protein [Streptomyces aurantiacus]WAU78426.1 hypothetical protein O1Q96_00865 [Streptomyces aurantiacus]